MFMKLLRKEKQILFKLWNLGKGRRPNFVGNNVDKLRNAALAIEYTQTSWFTQMQTYTLKSKGELYLKAVSLFVECRIQEAY